MGVNAQTSVPAFTAGQVLTAAEMTEVNTGIPVFATTVTRDAAFDGTGEKVLAEGQYAYIEATNTTQFYDGAAWQTVGGGLTLVKSQTLGTAVTSVSVTDAFSSTYTNYRIVVSSIDASLADQMIIFTLTGSSASYYSATRFFAVGGGSSEINRSNQASAYLFAQDDENNTNGSFDIFQPNLAEYTTWAGSAFTTGNITIFGGKHLVATAYTGFTLTNISGTWTGGTIRVYGYQNS
jgi:hypothetical protein